MDTCQFSFIGIRTGLKITVVGVEQAWEVLCAKLQRNGPGLPNGTHYFTISISGPQLFAVAEDQSGLSVYYHDCGQWVRYLTAHDISFGMIPDTGNGCPPRATC